jgi:hypothetical protein
MTQLNRKARMLGLGGISLAGLLVLGACGGGSNTVTNSIPPNSIPNTSAPTPTASTTVPPPPPDLQSELLTLSEVPTAWSLVNASSGPSSGASSVPAPPCLKNLTAQSHEGEITRAERTFHGSSSGIPFFDEQLASFAPGSLERKLPTYERAIAACGPITFTVLGYTFTGTIGPMPFPTVGDDSRAYQVNLSVRASGQNYKIGYDVVVARKGDTGVVLVIGDLDTPDLRQFQRLTREALAKVV